MKNAPDGRLVMDPPCAQGHTRQAMECPDCSERVTGKPASAEHRAWYAKRRNKSRRPSRGQK